MQPDAPLGLAFLGCGGITRAHSSTLRAMRAPVTLYYASRDAGRAAVFSRQLGGADWFSDYDAALADPRVDVALIATPPASHLDLTLRALGAGKHVIVEKPPFLTSLDFDAVAVAAATAQHQVLIAENYRYKPLVRVLRDLIASGEIGDLRRVEVSATKYQASRGWRNEPLETGRGALFEGGIHWINLIASLGVEVTSVRGSRIQMRDGLERGMEIAIEYANGATGVLRHSWTRRSNPAGLGLSRVEGTRGAARFESNGLFVLMTRPRLRLLHAGAADLKGYQGMFADFIAALRTGRTPVFTLAHARRDLKLVEAAYRTAI